MIVKCNRSLLCVCVWVAYAAAVSIAPARIIRFQPEATITTSVAISPINAGCMALSDPAPLHAAQIQPPVKVESNTHVST